jgi:hypothetical protein
MPLDIYQHFRAWRVIERRLLAGGGPTPKDLRDALLNDDRPIPSAVRRYLKNSSGGRQQRGRPRRRKPFDWHRRHLLEWLVAWEIRDRMAKARTEVTEEEKSINDRFMAGKIVPKYREQLLNNLDRAYFKNALTSVADKYDMTPDDIEKLDNFLI